MSKKGEGFSSMGEQPRVLLLTGAGVSSGSGIPDVKGQPEFQYKGEFYSYTELMTRRCFEEDPDLFWAYHDTLTERLQNKKPNPAHLFSRELHNRHLLEGVVTQNVDGLYNRVLPDTKVIEIHGNQHRLICSKCRKTVTQYTQHKHRRTLCCRALVEPGVLLIGDTYTKQVRREVMNKVSQATHLIVMGTQLQYSFVHSIVTNFNGKKILLNNEPVALVKTVRGIYGDIDYPVEWDEEHITDFNKFNPDEWVEIVHNKLDK